MFGRRLIVQHHRPVSKPLLALTVVALLVLVGFLAYVYGTATLSIKYSAVRGERDDLHEQLAAVREENRELREQIALLERSAEIDRKAYSDVDEHLLGLQMEVFALKEEVAFYRGIVSSTRRDGFHIQSFDVQQESVENQYRYQLVLTHDMKNDKVIAGTVTVSVAGEQDGRSRELGAEDLWPGTDAGIAFRLKHFQKVEGRFTLPEGFAPHSVTVQVVSAEDEERVAERTFNWPQPVGWAPAGAEDRRGRLLDGARGSRRASG